MTFYFYKKISGDNITKISILESEISSRRKVIESQPTVFSILQNLVSAGLNERDILMAFNIFKTDLCNNMPNSDRTYIECLSKDLKKYTTVRETLQGLNTKIWIKKSSIEKLAVVKSNLEAFFLIICSYLFLLYPFKCTVINTKKCKNCSFNI